MLRCRKRDLIPLDLKCPARNKECYKCKKVGHFGSQCRTPGSMKRRDDQKSYRETKRFRSEKVRAVDNKGESEGGNGNFIYNISDGGERFRIKIGGVMLQVLVDSGCNKNIISEKAWEYLKSNSLERWGETNDCKEVFLPYGENAKPLKVLGKFEAIVGIEDKGQEIIREVGLLGRITATDLGVLFIGLPSTYGVRAIESQGVKPFPKIKGIKLKIPIDRDVQPVCQHPRRQREGANGFHH